MATLAIPRTLFKNKISESLNGIWNDYKKLSNKGFIRGLMVVDQDAKAIAVNEFFDKKVNIWDLAALGAAMYGVSRQGKDFFNADDLERASMIYGNCQFFVRSIGSFDLNEKGRRELLIVVLADKKVNIGLIILQMKKYADQIKKAVEENTKIKETLKMSEDELRLHIQNIKSELFKKANGLFA